MSDALLQLIIAEAPGIINGIKALFRQQNPDAPEPTSDEVIAKFQEALASSLLVDSEWLKAHPQDPPPDAPPTT